MPQEPLPVDVIVDPGLWLSRLPVALLSRQRKAAELQEVVAEEARLAAYKAELVVALAEDSRADAVDGEVSEFFADELALVLTCARATATGSELRRLARRGRPEHPSADCGCAVLDAPRAVDRYRPSAAQQRFVRTRDRTCRHPDCPNPAGRADADHVIPHAAGGATDRGNLCCLCRRHHVLKTHARGWRFVMEPDGTLHVTTPSGVTRTTRPPGLDLPGLDPPGTTPDDDVPPY